MTSWFQIFPAIVQLETLRKLQIWIDHDESTSWTLVNERAILRPLEPLIEISDLDMSISLPKLHPLWENPYRHFIQDKPIFNIERRPRHIYHGKRNPAYQEGEFYVLERRDFPFLGNFENEVIDFLNEMGPEHDLKKWSAAKLEAFERDLWVKGGDPHLTVIEWDDFAHYEGCDWDLREPWLHQNIPWGE
jgi:hypothetical protein